MLSLDQIQRELKAIDEFDAVFLAERDHTLQDVVGFRERQNRRRELLELAKAQGAEH